MEQCFCGFGFGIVGKFRRPLPQPKWSSLVVSLFVFGIVSSNVGRDFDAAAGADALTFFGAAFMGMAFMAALLMIREAPEQTAAEREQRSSAR
jgi:hypothetical protein